MEKIFENKAVLALQRAGERMAGSKFFTGVSGGLMGAMGFMLLGALFQILATLLSMVGLIDEAGAFYQFLITPYNMSMGIISVIASFGIGYVYARVNKMKSPLSSGIVSAVLFMMVAAPAETVVLADGSEITAMNTLSLGGAGLFTAIIIGLLSVKITKFCVDKKWVIKMPDVVPSFLSDSFSALIPLVINVVIFHGLNFLAMTFMGANLPLIIMGILSIPLGAVNSIGGAFLASMFALALWLTGIHGTMVVFIALMPLYIQVITQNGALVAAGGEAVFHPVMLALLNSTVGGTGCTLGLVLLGLRSKSEQIKAVSKAALIPGLFNINEPVAFGMPTVYNPILAIPYIVAPMVITLLGWVGYLTGILKPGYIMMLSLLPLGMAEFLSTLSWTNLVFPFLMIPVSAVIYYPFYKIYERQLVAKETAAKAEAEA